MGDMPSNSHFASALRELVEKRPRQGLFARCFAEADGDEAKTKARYISLRAAEIEEEERVVHEAAQKELRKKEHVAQEAAQKELRVKEAAKRKLIESSTFESFQEEYRGEIPLQYYGRPERQKMFKQWRKQKLDSHGFADESA